MNDEEIKNFVLLWREKKETASEISCIAQLLNEKQKQIDIYKYSIDMCGTGGDKSNTFNISTLSAIVVSSMGVPVIKHSGRSTTSISGSVDILSGFGLKVDIDNKVKENCFKKNNLMFVSSKVLREVFGNVKKNCKELNIPAFVNLLGPLTNPYGTSYRLLGVCSIEWGKLLAESISSLKNKHAIVVCCKVSESVFLDELSFCGVNYIWEIKNNEVSEKKLNPEDLGCKIIALQELAIKTTFDAKEIFENILKGKFNKNDPKSSVVALNAGAALYLKNIVKSVQEGYKQALLHIQSGKSWEHFQNFLNCNK